MRILHTADWHVGQLFYEYDRTYEHQQFLNWLLGTLFKEDINVLLISGDIFDLSNPSAASVKMLYSFLNQAVKANPCLQIIITAGNHDSAARLESPKPLLESSNIHIIGMIEKGVNAAIDYDKITIPLKDKGGNIKAWCIAVPFLRMGDYPVISDCENPYSEGVAAFYKEAYEYVESKTQVDQAIIAMGHLHTQQAEISDIDKMERLIMGGIECISSTAFHESIAYVALGHIHKAQRIGSKEHIRYCGSPLPMSFSETNYKHQVIVFDLIGCRIENLQVIEIPLSVTLMRIPEEHSSLAEVLSSLQQLTTLEGNYETAPYIEVRVLLDGPEPGLRYKVETALAGKNARLAKIDVRYKTGLATRQESEVANQVHLNELTPLDVLNKAYYTQYNNSIPEDLIKLFQNVVHVVSNSEI
jgi:exonuclease SbcD